MDHPNSEIAKALVAAQAQMAPAITDSNNPHYKSKYASFEAVWSVCRKPLGDNGIAVVQSLNFDEKGSFLKTMLIHTSGESLEARCPLIVQKDDMQGLGSAITYARRYSLAAMVGVIQEDDDGNANAKKPLQSTQTIQNYKQTQDVKKNQPNVISEAQAKRLYEIAGNIGWKNEEVKILLKEFGYESSKEILKSDYEKICKAVENP